MFAVGQQPNGICNGYKLHCPSQIICSNKGYELRTMELLRADVAVVCTIPTTISTYSQISYT